MAEPDRKFFGISYQGVVFRYNVLPFGLAQACYAYTVVMKHMFQPLRAVGERLTFYLDDLFVASESLSCALLHTLTVVLVYVALGWRLSVAKCHLWPTQLVKFLGLMVDSRSMMFSIPQDKVAYILGVLQGILAAPAVSKRHLAKFAGLLAAVSPAVPMSRLRLHALYQIMTGQSDWDREFGPSEAGLAALRFWLDLRSMNGRSWVRSHRVVTLVGDVSETGFAGYTPNGELPQRITMGFSQEQAALMQQHKFSSTVRETLNALVCIKSFCDAWGERARGICLLFLNDNKGCIAALSRQSGSPAVYAVMQEAHMYAFHRGVQLEFKWAPRSDSEIVLADEYSRLVDPSAIFLSAHTFERVCARFDVVPTVDVFAGGNAGEHQAAKFYSEFFCPGTGGVDGLAHSWAFAPPGQRPWAWVFPPLWHVADSLNKIWEQRVNAVLILPSPLSHWTPLLLRLDGHITDKFVLQYHPGLFRLGSQAPPAWRVHRPTWSFIAYQVVYVSTCNTWAHQALPCLSLVAANSHV